MKKLIILSALTISSHTTVAHELELGVSGVDQSTFETRDLGQKRTQTLTGHKSFYAGFNYRLSDDLLIDTQLGYREIGSKKPIYDRSLKVLPRYNFAQFDTYGRIYGLAGLGGHSLLVAPQTSQNVYVGIVGIGAKYEFPANIGMGFEAQYEQSLKATDYTYRGVTVETSDFNRVQMNASLNYPM
jgi:hypothetical protein